MKKNIFILFLIIFNVFNSKDYTNEKSKEIRHYFISTKDFEYFKYDISNCTIKEENAKKLDFSTGVELYFHLDNEGNPIGKWELNLKTEDGIITVVEECYKDTKMIKKYIYSYNPYLKKRTLEIGAIYYPIKERIYYIDYNLDDQAVKNVYLEMDNDIYRFYIKNKKELVITKTIISKYPSFISLYETYKNEINKILEVEN